VGRAHAGGGRKAAFFWSLKTAEAEAVKQRGAGALEGRHHAAIGRRRRPSSTQITDWEQLTLARYAHRTTLPPHADGIAFIGDSAHSTSPQLGQGANMALLDAAALAHALSSAASRGGGAGGLRGGPAQRHVRLFQLLSYVFTPFYQSDSPVGRLAARPAGGDRRENSAGAADPGRHRLRHARPIPFARAGLQECRWPETALREA
jgi:2-polyprenyl-6-methoxyphenol hydroxylase-like FAD-dependent oxidoreductase